LAQVFFVVMVASQPTAPAKFTAPKSLVNLAGLTERRKWGVLGVAREEEQARPLNPDAKKAVSRKMDAPRTRSRPSNAKILTTDETVVGSSIAEKEVMLELIMCAEAESQHAAMNAGEEQASPMRRRMTAGFDQLASLDLKTEYSLWAAQEDHSTWSDDEAELDEATAVQKLDGTAYAVCWDCDVEMMVPVDLVQGSDMTEIHSQFTGNRIDVDSLPVGFSTRGGTHAEAGGNQDGLAIASWGPYSLFAVSDGHGLHGSCVTRIVTENLPSAVFGDRDFPHDIKACFTRAFRRLHRALRSDCDCRFSGAALAVVLFTPEKVWVGNVGDVKVLVGMPDTRALAEEYHFEPVELSTEHMPSHRGEFDRLTSSGAEVRRHHGDHLHRVFLPNQDYPALTITRSIGDYVAHTIGVSSAPDVGFINRDDISEKSFLVLTTTGVYSQMSTSTIVNWIGRNFPCPGQAAASLTQEAQDRWAEKRLPIVNDVSALIILLNGDGSEGIVPSRTFAVGPMMLTKTTKRSSRLNKEMASLLGIHPDGRPATPSKPDDQHATIANSAAV